MIAGTLIGFGVAAFALASIGGLLRAGQRMLARANQADLDAAGADVLRALADDRRLAAGVVAQAISEAWRAGKHPVGYRILNHPSGDVIDVICAEDAAANAEQILREGE